MNSKLRKYLKEDIFKPMGDAEKTSAHKAYVNKLPTEDEAIDILLESGDFWWIEDVTKIKKKNFKYIGATTEDTEDSVILSANELIEWAWDIKQNEAEAGI
jgi:hypothetical protein